MVLHLGEQLDVPLRERNQLLLAAGYAPVYRQTALDAPHMAAVRDAVRQVLSGHEPSPAVVVDRAWNLVDANRSVGLFTEGLPQELLTPPINVLRVSLHPAGVAPHIVNLGEWRAHLLGRLQRQVALTADAELERLYEELRAYPCDQPEPDVELPNTGDVVVPLRIPTRRSRAGLLQHRRHLRHAPGRHLVRAGHRILLPRQPRDWRLPTSSPGAGAVSQPIRGRRRRLLTIA